MVNRMVYWRDIEKTKVYSWYIKWYTQGIWHGLSTVFQEEYEKILKIYYRYVKGMFKIYYKYIQGILMFC